MERVKMSDKVVLTVTSIICLIIVTTIFYAVNELQKDGKITEERANNIKEWLKYAVAVAEKELGGGTGQIKLRLVYNMAIESFENLDKLITFNTFSTWVDESLVWLNNQIGSNSSAAQYICGEKEEQKERK